MLREKCPNTGPYFSGPYIPTEETPYSDGKNLQKFSFHAVTKKAEFILR